SDADGLTRLQWRKARADQIEIADAIDFVVIGDAAIAIAEAEFWPDIDFDAAASGIAAAKGAAGRPAVARKRPGDFAPGRLSGHDGGAARQRAERQHRGEDGGPALHCGGNPAMARAGPVSSSMCRPVLARSTM